MRRRLLQEMGRLVYYYFTMLMCFCLPLMVQTGFIHCYQSVVSVKMSQDTLDDFFPTIFCFKGYSFNIMVIVSLVCKFPLEWATL